MNFRIGPVITILFLFIVISSASFHLFFEGEIRVEQFLPYLFPVLIACVLFYLFIKRTFRVAQKNHSNSSQKFVLKEITDHFSIVKDLKDEKDFQKRYLEDLLKTSLNLIVSWKKNGEILSFNDSALEAYGFLEKGQPYKTIYEFLSNHADYVAQKVIDDAAHGKAIFGYETILLHKTGRQVLIWDVVPHLDENGQVDYIVACGLDTTKLRNSERKNRLSAQLFEASIEAIIITDDKGDIIDVNNAFVDITGFERNEVIGRNAHFMRSERHDDAFNKDMMNELIDQGFWKGVVWDVRKNGQEFPKELSITASKNPMGRITNYIAIFSDISDKIRDQEKLQTLAHFDALTELPNRVLFNDRLNTALARARRDQDLMCLMFVDLDRFKQVNDTLGHRVGDELLKEVSRRLKHCVREIDTVSRLSGDEFTVILTDIVSQDDINNVAERMVKSVSAPYFIEGHELFISASIGIAVFPEHGENVQDLLRNADIAMYDAKNRGRNNYQYFNEKMTDRVSNELSITNQLRICINRDEIKPYYQLKVDSLTGLPVGMEALARWKNDHNQYVSPVEFIPVAEENGLIVKLGTSILKQVCAQIRMWQDMNFEFGRVSVNLSAKQFRDMGFIDTVKEAIAEHRVSPNHLEFEITENVMMEDIENARRVLSDLKKIGIHISIDDFGTGYSSLNYLKKFPVDALKIDRSFIRDIIDDSDDSVIVSAIVSMSEKLNIGVVVEGVETLDQLNLLSAVGCRIIQGYYYAKPCPGAEVPLVWSQVVEEFSEMHAIMS